ncbi:MAG: hypothetical protein IJT90_00585 [Bacteroidaceae bacterium]|nr:hypothetical protein [Bacteroidaceae bacterium]
MKTKNFILSLLGMMLCTGGFAKIVMDAPVISDNYLKFVGTNEANNYKYTLDTYEWASKGPQFQLTIEALDTSKPAAITTADLTDENFWEPLFRKYTKQLAGEEMEAYDNVKRVYAKNVALLANQFSTYGELHIIGIEASGDYTIPDGCFQNCTKLDNLESNVQGTLTLGSNIVSPQPMFIVTCSTPGETQAWTNYKNSNGCNFTVAGSGGGITMEEPVISDGYICFVGVNATNNYKYTLNTYEWADRGPQFQLIIETLDASKPAAFTADDLNDENYWEPLFRKYTKQLAGEEMEAKDNIKELYIKNVALLPNQFANYEYLHTIGIEAGGDYTVPNGVFSGVSRLDNLDCSVAGNLTLGDNIVNPKLTFTVNCTNDTGKQVWQQYKEKNSCNYIIGGDSGDGLKINEVSVSLSVNGYSTTLPLSDKGGTLENLKGISEAYLDAFTAKTSGDVTEVTVDYCVCAEGVVPSSEMWKNISASQSGDGEWKADNVNLYLLDGLNSNSSYRLYFSFHTNDNGNGRATYPSDGSMFQLNFSTGEITGIAPMVNAQRSMSNDYYTLDGRRINGQPTTRGIYIRGGKKILVK